MTKPIVVVLGRASFRKNEIPDLTDFGQMLAIRGKQLLTTNSNGATQPIRDGYTAAGGTVQFLKPGDTEPFDGRYKVVLFTDKRMQDQLDERMPDWKERVETYKWAVIHNPKETESAVAYLRRTLRELGTPLPDGG